MEGKNGLVSEASAADFVVSEGTLTSYNGTASDVVIPAGLGITAIGEAFNKNMNLRSVIIPEGVTSIKFGAFSGCGNLAGITIPASVTSIGGWAFAECKSLKSIIVPAGVTSIEEWTFGQCGGLTSVTLQEGIVSIGRNAFLNCSSLTSITVPKSVTSVDYVGAFFGCKALPAEIRAEISRRFNYYMF